MDPVEVPQVASWPDQSAEKVDVISSADFLLTRLLAQRATILHAEYDPEAESVTWFLETRDAKGDNIETPIATSPSLGLFRAVLARFGYHYMNI